MTAAYAAEAHAGVTSGVANVSVATAGLGTISSGDLLVAFCWTNNSTAAWSAAGFTSFAASGDTAILYRIADGSEGSSFTFTRTVSTNVASVIVARITGAHATTPLDVATLNAGVGSTTVVLSSITPTGPNRLLLQMVGRANTGGTGWTPPGTATERFDYTIATSLCLSAGGDEVVGASATGTRTWTHGVTGPSRGIMVAIVPGAGDVTPTGIASGEALGSPTLSQPITVSPTGIGDPLANIRAKIASRDTARVNIGLFGASVVEGYPAPPMRWIEQQLAAKLRNRYQTSGIGSQGGMGFIGIPTLGLENTATSPIGMTGATFNETFGYGGHHRYWSCPAALTYVLSLTMPAAATRVAIQVLSTVGGHATGGKYRINGGAYTNFSTLAASDQTTEVVIDRAWAAGDVLEITKNTGTTGPVNIMGFYVSNGDESKGIQVHNHGHYGYRIQDWNVARSGTDPGFFSKMKAYDLIIMSDFGGNDGGGPGSLDAATFTTQFADLVDWMRTAGFTGDILISSLYDISAGRTFVDPWSSYVAGMKAVAKARNLGFVQLDQLMPATPNAIYDADNVHGNADGSAYALMADIFFKMIESDLGEPTVTTLLQSAPTGIASGEALGQPAVSQAGGLQTAQPTGIATAEATGTPTLGSILGVQPTGIASVEALGQPSLAAFLTAIPTGVASAEALGQPTLGSILGASPSGIASQEAVGVPSIQTQLTVNPTGVASAETLGQPVVAAFLTSAPTGIASAEALGQPSVLGKLDVAPSGIVSAEALGQPVIGTVMAVIPTGIASAEALGQPIISTILLAVPTGIASCEALGQPSTASQSTVIPTGVASAEALGQPSVSTMLVAVPVGIASLEALGNPTVGTRLIVTPDGVASVEALGQPAIHALLGVRPDSIASGESLGNVSVSTVVDVVPDGIESDEALGLLTVLFGDLVYASAIIAGQKLEIFEISWILNGVQHPVSLYAITQGIRQQISE